MASRKAVPLVGILMGSDSDLPVMKGAAEALKSLGIPYEINVLSAHRTPDEAARYAKGARKRGLRAIIAGAGGAAHLAGAMAAHSDLPVIGVPVSNGALKGHDALLSTAQMPRGIPVATVAIDGAYNAGMLAGQIISVGDDGTGKSAARALVKARASMRKKVLAKKVRA